MADQDSKEGIKQQDSDAKVSIVVRAAQYGNYPRFRVARAMTVVDFLLGDLNFNVKPEFKFEKLAKKWCQHQQLDPKTIRFLTEDGQRIQNNSLVKDVSIATAETFLAFGVEC